MWTFVDDAHVQISLREYLTANKNVNAKEKWKTKI